MSEPTPSREHASVLKKLASLRTELVDLAFVLDRRGRPDAADVAMITSARIAEICNELEMAEQRECILPS